MSTTIDNKVVKMEFDNRNFESNVKTTMSTLDKLKHALKLDGVAKSFDSITSASKKVNLSGLQNGVETVRARFSALDVVAVTALSNITTAAMRAGKNLVSQFTIDPITSGFREYETQMNAVQTILANTADEGATITQVTAALDELNEYADKTIYNFTEMSRNIGTFTAAGVDLDQSVQAIKGIANLAAVSGSSSQQASTAMYQLSQALAAGRVSLMDWNSVVNAGMGGEIFQEALKRTSRNLETGVDAAIETYGTFRESLTKGEWLTTEVLTETLAQISGAYSEAELLSQGYTQQQAADIMELAQRATDAATKVKTFTQLMDTMKEAAGSGWAKTWQLLLGDFEEAKSFFTSLSGYFGEMIEGSSEARNNLIGGAFNSNWVQLTQEIEKAGVPLDTFSDKLKQVAKEHGVDIDQMINDYEEYDLMTGKVIKGQGNLAKVMESGAVSADIVRATLKSIADSGSEMNQSTTAMTDKLEHFQKVVKEVWQGDWKNGQEKIEALTKAGYDYAEVQDLVNKTVDGHKLTLEDLSDTQMKAIGFTDEQINSLQRLSKQAEETGTPISELIDNLNKKSGRMLFLESIANVLKAISEPLRAIKKAFNEVFAIDSGNIYSMVENFHRFSEAIVMSDESLDKLSRTFKGIFGVVKIFTSLISGGFGIAFKALTLLLEKFDLNLLDVTATIGDVVWAFADFITFGETFEDVMNNIGSVTDDVSGYISDFVRSITGIDIGGVISSIGSGLESIPGISGLIHTFEYAYTKISDYIKKFEGLDFASVVMGVFKDAKKAFTDFTNFMKNITWDDVIQGLTKFGEKVRENFTKLKEKFEEIGPDLIEGLQNGLKDNFDKAIEWMKEIGEKIIEAIKAVLGIHSPSTVMFEIGQNIVQGLIDGIKSVIGGVADIFRGLGSTITEAIGPIDWGAVGVAIFGAGMLMSLYKFTDALQGFATAAKNVTAPAAGIGKVATSISEAIDIFANNPSFKGGTKLQNMAKAFETFAKSIGIVAASVAALALLDPNSLWNAVGVIGVLALIMGGLTAVLSKVATSNKDLKVLDTVNISGIILSLGAAFVLLGIAAKTMGGIDETAFDNAKRVLIAFGACITALMLVGGGMGSKWVAADLSKTASFIGKIGTCFLLLGITAKLLGTIDDGAYENAKRMLTSFAVVVSLLIGATSLAKGAGKASKFISKIGVAFMLLAATAKILGGMSTTEMDSAEQMLATFTIIVAALVAVAGTYSSGVDKASDFIIKVGIAFAALAVASRLLGGMSDAEMVQAGKALLGLTVVIGLLVAITNIAPTSQIAKISGTLIAMSLAIGILAGISVLLSFVKTENLVKGIAAVGALSLLMSMMTFATRGASDVKGTMIGIAIAIGVMAAAIAVLSFIEPQRVAVATVALSAVMAMLALVTSQAGKAQGAMKELIVISAAIAIIGGILYLLAGLPTESVLGSAASLSLVLLSLAASCKILDTVNKVSTSALITIGALTLIVGALAGIFGLMSYMGVEAALPSAIAISAVLLAMSAACVILGTISSVSTTAMVAMGALTLIVGGLAIILGLMTGLNVEPSIETAAALSIMLLGMSAAMLILAPLGPLATGAIAAAGSLAAVLGILTGVVLIAGGIKQIPGVDWLVSEGGEFLQKIGEAIGKFVGGFAGGVLDGLSSNLVSVADNLSNFIVHLTPFLIGVKMIDPSMGAAIDSLVGMIMSLTASSFVTGIADLLGISTDFGALGDKLVPFGMAMQRFSAAIVGIDAGAIQASATAGQALAELANSLPKSGGLAQAIFGEVTDLASFGTQLVLFGTGIKAYSLAITGIDAGAIQASATAGQALSDLANSLPKEGGLSQAIFGTTDGLDTFGSQLVVFGTGLKLYSMAVTGLAIEPIQQSVAAARSLNELAGQLGSEGGVLEFFTGGEKGLDTFGGELESFGGALKAYSDSLIEVNFEAISNATSKASSLANFGKSLKDADFSGVENLKKLDSIGTTIKGYSDTVADIDFSKVSASTMAITTIIASVNSMANINVDAIATFKAAIAELGTVNLNSVISAFEGAGSRAFQAGLNFVQMLANGFLAGTGVVQAAASQVLAIVAGSMLMSNQLFVVAGMQLANSVASGINNGQASVSSAVRSLVSNASSTLRSYRGSFESSGSYVASGFAAGIRSGIAAAASAAARMASAASAAAKRNLDINSPSKVFRKIGSAVPEGFAQGIDRFSYMAENSAASMADNAVKSTSEVLSGLSNSLDLDADMDLNPVITPVLDLDNVKNGAAAIDGLLSSKTSVGVLRSVDSINRRMNQNIQNGANDDVVSAIDKLRKGLDNVGNNYYTVDGITYDDGTNIANAVGQLIRATKVERRR